MDIDKIDADTDLSYYAVDHRRSVWGHLLDLADLSGSEITCAAGGGLRFLPINPLPSTTRFRYGAELLSWRAASGVEGTPLTYAAHGSASESGSEKWHWVNPDPTGGAGASQVIGAFHSRSLAEALSTAAESSARRAGIGERSSLPVVWRCAPAMLQPQRPDERRSGAAAGARGGAFDGRRARIPTMVRVEGAGA